MSWEKAAAHVPSRRPATFTPAINRPSAGHPSLKNAISAINNQDERPVAAKIYLPIIEPTDEDSIIGGTMPVLVGDNPEENLACGRCKSVIAKNASTLDLGKRFASPSGRLILQCECGALNAVTLVGG